MTLTGLPADEPLTGEFSLQPPASLEEALERSKNRVDLQAGEMRADVDPRMAALQLVSPLLLACLHQDQLEGAHLRAMNLEKLIASTCGAFLRAFATAPPVWGTDEPPEPVLAAADWR